MSTVPEATNSPRLYGIEHSNRNNDQLWGKNQFNSTFPTALACYMRDKGVSAVYLNLGPDLKIHASEISIGDLFNTVLPNSELRFDFESKYVPYQQYALDDIGGIDLVVKHQGDSTNKAWRRPLEIKLTVTPDNATCKRGEEAWSPELVIRPASTKYCALGIYDACRARAGDIRDIFRNFCGNFEHWNSKVELDSKRADLLRALNGFQDKFRELQQPFLLQPIWKTQGQSPSLAEQSFDLFVWSDFALFRTFIDRSKAQSRGINRFTRESARLARVLYVLSTQQSANLEHIYTEMAYGYQTDKAFSLNGQATRPYLDSPRRVSPCLGRDIVAEVILGGGEKRLSPERRFDATIYFTARAIFDAQRAEEVPNSE